MYIDLSTPVATQDYIPSTLDYCAYSVRGEIYWDYWLYAEFYCVLQALPDCQTLLRKLQVYRNYWQCEYSTYQNSFSWCG